MTDPTDEAIRPVLVSGVVLSLVRVQGAVGEQALYRVSHPSGGRATLPAPLVAIVLLFDGERSCAEIDATIRGWDMRPPREDFVVFLARQLSRAALVQLLDRPMETLEPHRFACQMCGKSCRGADIGPLSAARVAILEDQQRELVAQGLLAPHVEPLCRDDDGRVWLRRGTGCSFLLDDNRCLLHAHFGFDAKPLACRLFPLVAVDVGGTVRLGMSGACMRHHHIFEHGEPVEHAQVFEAMEGDGVRPLRRAYRKETDDARDATAEAAFIRGLVRRGGLGLAELLGLWSGALDPDAAGLPLDDALVSELRRAAARWARHLLERCERGVLPSTIPRGGEREANVRKLAEVVAGPNLDAVALDALPARWRRYVAYRLRNHLWLRVGYRHGSLRDALLVFTVGVVVATLYARGAESVTHVDDEAAWARFGEAMTLSFLLVGDRREADSVVSERTLRWLRRWCREATRHSPVA